PCGASFGASILGIPCLSFRSGSRCFHRWVRRLFECSLGRGSGMRDLNLRPSILSAFTRHFLSGFDAISGISTLRRRVQGHGACALGPRLIPRRYEKGCPPPPRWRFRAKLKFLPSSSRGLRLSVG